MGHVDRKRFMFPLAPAVFHKRFCIPLNVSNNRLFGWGHAHQTGPDVKHLFDNEKIPNLSKMSGKVT